MKTSWKPRSTCTAWPAAPFTTTTTTNTVPEGTPRSCVDATPPNCDGTCNDFNKACRPDESGTACLCAYVDVWGDCPMAGSSVLSPVTSCSSGRVIVRSTATG